MQRGAKPEAMANVVEQQPHLDRSLPEAAIREVSREAGRGNERRHAPDRGVLHCKRCAAVVASKLIALGTRAMSEKNPIRLYVTHAFATNTDYHRVFEYL